MENEYTKIVQHYEQCFLKHGDNHKGVDWPNQSDLNKRFRVAYELTQHDKRDNFSLLDFGCGNGLFIDFLSEKSLIDKVQYTGLDLSPLLIACCQKKYPALPFICGDVLQLPHLITEHDYIILNGVLTEKCSLDFATMWEFTKTLLVTLFQHCKTGMAFNVMSEHVDWKREDLFHLPFDVLADFLRKNISRNYTFRQDYGLYEYTTYIYR